jgi:serine/threonine protein phosphatase PrpC
MLRFGSAGRSHPGLVRTNNEDSGFAGPTLQLVADGVGGAAAGEVASATAAYVTSALALAALRTPEPDLLDVLARAVRLSHEQLKAGTAADPARSGMGTTLTALLTDGTRVALVHVGDSRAYLLRDGELTRLTRDHTYVQTLVDAGVLSPDEVRRHPRRNVVLQAVDGERPATPDLDLVDVRVGDRLLLCSDGLSDLVEDEQLRACLEDADPQDAANALVDAALAAGGRDNVTCLVSDVQDGPRVVGDGRHLGAFCDPYLIVDPAAVHALPG